MSRPSRPNLLTFLSITADGWPVFPRNEACRRLVSRQTPLVGVLQQLNGSRTLNLTFDALFFYLRQVLSGTLGAMCTFTLTRTLAYFISRSNVAKCASYICWTNEDSWSIYCAIFVTVYVASPRVPHRLLLKRARHGTRHCYSLLQITSARLHGGASRDARFTTIRNLS